MKPLSARAWLLAAFLAPLAAPLAAEARTGARVDGELWEALERSPDGRVLAVVVLRAPELPPGADLAARRAEVDAVQERVLAALAPDELRLRYHYDTFGALTGRATRTALEVLAAHPDVLHLGVDGRGGVHLAESVPFVGADTVHGLGYGGEGVTVAVLDTGVDTDHPDLVADLAPGAWHFLDGGGDVGPGAEDAHGHGTHVSSIITSDGIVGSVGVAPDADVLAVQVIGPDGTGWISDFAAGVDYVTGVAGDYDELAAINMSIGTFESYASCPCDAEDVDTALLATALQAAKDTGIATFAASGNDGECGSMSAPACNEAAVAVAAVFHADEGTIDFWGVCTDATSGPDQVACFSNRGACNALAAPGVGIEAAALGGGLVSESGTSMAAPHVTGVAALMADVNPGLTPDVVEALLGGTGVATGDPCGSSPNPIRVDAAAAVAAVVPAGELITSGLPPNPDVFGFGVTSKPVIGQVWDPVIDHESFQKSALADFVVISAKATNTPSPFGTVLCAPPLLAVVLGQPGQPFHVPIPAETAHLGLSLCTQGASLDPSGAIALTNAIEIRIGAY